MKGGGSVDCVGYQRHGVMVSQDAFGIGLCLFERCEADDLNDVDFASFGVFDDPDRALFKVEVALVEKIE